MAARTIQLTPLALETRTALPTPEAAGHLNRAQQTLRIWAMRGAGPIQPLRINGRLAWPVLELKRLLGVEVAA
ncbi:MAG: DNA-binding protein [Burkholderiaceae bacterium]|nr:DNA-binding protein [Burkholderiaceae bacterium]